LAEDSDAENGSEPQSLPRSHAGNVHSEAIEAPVSSTSDAEEDEMDEVDDNFSSIEEEDVVEMQDEETILSFGEEDVELVLQPLFEGVAVSLPTLFDEDGDVEYKTTARLGKRLVDNGVNAIFVATIDGEGNTLSRKERKNLVRSVAKSTDELVVADVTAPSIRQSVQIAGDCFEAGANAFIVTLDSNTRDPYALCEAIHSENRDAALFVKLAGPVDSLPISPEFLYDLPISGVIDATADITFFLHLVSAYSGPVYVGSTSMITTGHLMGAAGVVLVSVAINQDLVAQAFEGDAQAQAELAMWERETGSGQGSSRSVKLALESENLVSSAMRD